MIEEEEMGKKNAKCQILIHPTTVMEFQFTLTDVPACCQIHQVSPLQHLWFVLKVSEIVRDTSHQFKAWKPIKKQIWAAGFSHPKHEGRTGTWLESIHPQEFYQLVQFGEVILDSSTNVSTTRSQDRKHKLKYRPTPAAESVAKRENYKNIYVVLQLRIWGK